MNQREGANTRNCADAASIKRRLVLETLSNTVGDVTPKSEAKEFEFYETYGSDEIVAIIIAVIRKMARKLT